MVNNKVIVVETLKWKYWIFPVILQKKDSSFEYL